MGTMRATAEGLFQKFKVSKIGSNKQVDAIVLEFDDKIGRVGIHAWALEMRNQGYEKVATDVFEKLYRYERARDEPKVEEAYLEEAAQ